MGDDPKKARKQNSIRIIMVVIEIACTLPKKGGEKIKKGSLLIL